MSDWEKAAVERKQELLGRAYRVACLAMRLDDIIFENIDQEREWEEAVRAFKTEFYLDAERREG